MNVSPLQSLPGNHTEPSRRSLSRRRILGATVALVAGTMLAPSRSARASVAEWRTLAFFHTHTREQVAVPYAMHDSYLPDALATLNWFLRDFRNGAVHAIDPRLFDQLHALAAITKTQTPFQVISGYRSPATNQALRARSAGVADHSLHLEGRAIDIRLADVPLADLRDAALSLRAGGVGYYPGSQFVHVDTGSVRRW